MDLIKNNNPKEPLTWEYTNSIYSYVRDFDGRYFRMSDESGARNYLAIGNIALVCLLDERYEMEKK